MQLSTFLAKDMREALANVRAEMGDDAVIVASEKGQGRRRDGARGGGRSSSRSRAESAAPNR